ncbi:MAG: cytochrome c biogenesis protein CcsA [Phycisphaerae bacterium]|nr:cytochrome c biogenesis protein CcsA [Phycisphaerae bacterium]
MLDLLPLERQLFWGILILSAVSSVLAHLQIVRENVRYRRLLVAFTSVQITLAAVLLILRAVAIKAFPITGVFESMLILLVFIGITFLFLSAFMPQVWFLSVMAWVLFVISILTSFVARPASVLQEAARTPWVIVHALSMALSGAMIVFAAAMSVLFLWSRKRLKSGRFSTLFGKMPTVEKLENLNLMGLHLSFIIMTFGLVSGIGLVAVKSAGLSMTLGDWLTDSKIVLVTVAWIALLVSLILRRLLALSGKAVAQATLTICFVILFAFIGSKVFCKSDHDFINKTPTYDSQVK